MRKCIYQPNPNLGTWFHATMTMRSDGSIYITPNNKTRDSVVRSPTSGTYHQVLDLADRKPVNKGDRVCLVSVEHLRGLDSDMRLGDILKVTGVSSEGVTLQGEEGILHPLSAVQAY